MFTSEYTLDFETLTEVHSPERISKVDADAEVAAGPLHAVHANPQLPRVASARGESKNGKELHKKGAMTEISCLQQYNPICAEAIDDLLKRRSYPATLSGQGCVHICMYAQSHTATQDKAIVSVSPDPSVCFDTPLHRGL